jgi:transglutaminase-like putative cysteine protease
MKTKILLFLSVLAFATLSVCAEETNFTAAEWSFVNPQTVLSAAAEITPEKYPNSDAATVEAKSVRDYHVDGTGECQDETFTKVLTEKGKRENRGLAFAFMLPYQTVEVAKLEVLKPNGTAVPVDITANSKESIDDSQMSANIYDPNSRILRVNIPQLEIGDIVHTISREIIHRSIMPNEYDEVNVFEGTGYIRHQSYEVHAPASLPLQRIGLRDEVKGTMTSSTQTNGDSVVYHWEINNVPRMFEEANMPPYDMVLQRLFVSTVPTWQDISKWYWNLSKPHLDMITPEMKQTVADLTKDKSTDLEKVKAIFYYVSKKVRYMGLTPEKDRPGFEPHDVSITFGKKYGVCRDKAGLLVEMLRLGGFNAYPVLINIGAKRDMEVPQLDFNHAITCVELKPGEYTLMDATDENTLDLLPSSDCNRSYLVCRPEGETLRVSPVQPPENHMLSVKTTGTLDASGALDATSEISFVGVNDDAYRNHFAHLKPDEIKRFFEGRLKDVIPGTRLTSVKMSPEDMLDTSQPLHAQLKFTATGLTANGEGKSVVSLPWISRDLGIANRLLIGSIGLEKRKYPLQTEVACGAREDVSLKLTGGFAAPLSLPEFPPIHDNCIDYDVNAAVKDNTLVCSRELKLKSVEFSPEQYLELKQTLKDISRDRRKNLILALNSKVSAAPAVAVDPPAPPVGSNAKILYSEKRFDVKDAHSAVYRAKYSKQILTYNGKIREAEVKIPYNPACQEVKITRAVVTSKTGERQEISPGEINLMDEGWNASAKRYTGGKVLVASLPGVDIGSTIEVEYEISTHDAPCLTGYESFQFPDELDQKSVELTAPADLRVQSFVGGPVNVVTEHHEKANGSQKIQWQAKDIKGLPTESQVPPEWTFASGLEYFVGDAADYWKSVSDAMLLHSHHSVKAAELASKLTDGAKTKADAAKAIRDFIAKNIRSAGPSFTSLPLRELSDADRTLADGYGHAADRAILYYAMLSAAGFKPEFVMASGLPPVDAINKVAKKMPLPDNFAMPLVRISIDGENYYLNDTDQYAQLGTTGYDGKLGIVLAKQKMETISAVKNCDDKADTDFAISLSDNGKARITVSIHSYGNRYNAKRQFFAELPPEERNRYFQEAVSSVAQGARAVGDLTTKFDTYPGLEQFTVDLDNYGVVDGKYLYLNLPFTPYFIDAGTAQRSLPLYISDRREVNVHAEIELPPGYVQTDIVPKTQSFSASGGSQVHVTATSEPGKCVVTDNYRTAPAIINTQEYLKLVSIQSELGQKSATTLLLEKK